MSAPATHITALSIEGLRTSFFTEEGEVRAVDGVDLAIMPGETLALVGESGCGKTALALSVLRILPAPQGRIKVGSIRFLGKDLVSMPEEEVRRLRGDRIAMIFQEPSAALNPVMKVGEQIGEAYRLHRNRGKAESRAAAVEMLRRVGIPLPERRVDEYPHLLSGGMRQRVMIAMALICNPDVLIADEPTTAVDVTVQAQLIALLRDLQAERKMAILLITHDLSVVSEMADRVAVMYASKIVERAGTHELLKSPKHPYTKGLMESLPKMEASRKRLDEIKGAVPDPAAFPPGCRFHPRCPRAQERCISEEPLLRELRPGGWAACHFPLE